jgi:hypothetical protein
MHRLSREKVAEEHGARLPLPANMRAIRRLIFAHAAERESGSRPKRRYATLRNAELHDVQYAEADKA